MKKIWRSITAFFIMFFGSEKKLEKFLLKHADEGIEFFTRIRQTIESPLVDLALVFTPDYVDNVILNGRAAARIVLDKVITGMLRGKECLQKQTLEEKLICFVNETRELREKAINKTMLTGASLYVELSAEKPVKESMADTAVIARLAQRKIDSGAWVVPDAA